MTDKEIREPSEIAEYDQMKAEAYAEIDRLHREARQVAGEGHDELCLVALFYTRTMNAIRRSPTIEADVQQLVQMLTFALIQGADLPNPDQIGCEH